MDSALPRHHFTTARTTLIDKCLRTLPRSFVYIGYFVAAADVVDANLGRELLMKPILILENSRRKLHEKNGHSKDRFISIDIGPIAGHLIILKCISTIFQR